MSIGTRTILPSSSLIRAIASTSSTGEREADRHSVHDALVEDRREVRERTQERPAGGHLHLFVIHEADDVEAELGMLRELLGKRLAACARPHDDDEPGVVPLLAQPPEAQPQHDAGRQGEDELRGEQGEEEEAADVRLAEEEEHREREEGHHDRRPCQVRRLGTDGPAGPGSVQAVEGEDAHPADRVQGHEGGRLGDHLAPVNRPVGAEPQDGQHHEQAGGSSPSPA
jgi:hypothetical protein